ncbi:MAG: hypothetical protein IJU76_04040 [Desulfovibrionaceae bacterium]|nr:hypothetical protein [Desulfovibrionaceae bacterium]
MNNYNKDLADLVIKNSLTIENAQKVLSDISTEFLNSLSEYVKGFFKSKQWICDYTNNEDDLYFRKETWTKNGSVIASFYLWYEEESKYFEYLTIAVGNTPKFLAFGFTCEYTQAAMNRPRFRAFLRQEYANQNFEGPFSLTDDGLGIKIPFTLSAESLAEFYPDFTRSFDNIDIVLENIENNIDKFNKIVEDFCAANGSHAKKRKRAL